MTMLLMLVTAVPLPVLDLNCTLDPEKPGMRIEASVTCSPTEEDTNKAVFFLSDRMHVPKVRILAPENLKGETTPKVASTRDHDVTYEIQLPGNLKKDERLKLGFEYTNKDSKGFVYMLGSKACFAGGYNTCWFPSVGDSRRMLGRMRFESPAGYVVKASGKELPATETGGTRTSQFEILQHTVPTFAAARYKVTRVNGTVPMTVYLLKERPVAQTFAEGCSKILAVLTKEFGKYPFPDFSIIETPSPESGTELGFTGASFEGFMFADSNSIDGGFNTAYFGHEMGHQWWGNLVQRRGTKGAFVLSEGLAQYGSLQCVEAIEGPALAKVYRTTGYPGYSNLQSGVGALAFTASEADRPISNLPPEGNSIYHQFANSKGFLTWDTLARQIGRERFRKALHAVTTKYAWTAVSFDEFVDEIRAASGKNVDSILSQWLDRTGAPMVWCDWKQEKGAVSITVKQSMPLYQLALPVVIEFADGSSMTKEVSLTTESQTLSLSVKQAVASVQVDPNFTVLHYTPHLQKRSKDMKLVTESIAALFSQDQKLAEEKLLQALAALPKPDTFGVAFYAHSGLGNLYRNQGKFKESKEQYELALGSPNRDLLALPYTYYNYGFILSKLGDQKGSDAALRNAENADAALTYRSGVSVNIAAFRSSSGK